MEPVYKKSIAYKLLIIGAVFLQLSVFAQTTEIRGRVLDGKTKEPLSYTNVRIKGTITGTTTDEGGFYFLRTPEKSDSIVFSYLGYPTKTIRIQRGATQELNVELGSEDISLNQVIVKAGKRKKYIDTTANFVYAQVRDNRNKNREKNIDSYSLEEYNKSVVGLLNPNAKFLNWKIFKPFRFAFENKDTFEEGKVFLRAIMKEDLVDVYYRKKPEGLRRYTKATQITGVENTSISELANGTFETIDAYDNLFVIAGKSFVGPFAPGALLTYRYFLTDTTKIDDRVSYKLHFVGISKVDLALKGYAWIDSATWGIQSIYFRPNEKSNLNFISDYSISQQFKLVKENTWMLSNEFLQSVGSIFKRKNAMSVLLQKTYERRNIKLDVPLEDTLFKKSEKEFIAPNARKYSRDYWNENRFIPLNRFEEKVIFIHDTFPKVPAYKRWMWTLKLFTTAYFEAGPVEFGRFYKFASKNNIEGWRLRFGARTNRKFSEKVNLQGYVAYGTRDKDWKHEAVVKIVLPSRNDNWSMLTIYNKYDLNVLGQENPLLTFDNIVTLVRGQLLTRMMKIRETHIDIEQEWARGYSSIMSIDNRTYFQIPGIFDFNTMRPDGKVRNLSKFNTTEFGIDTRLAPKSRYYKAFAYRYFVKNQYPVFLVRYNLGLLDMDDGYIRPYHKLMLTAQQRLSWVLGHTNYELKAAKIFGPAPYPISYVTAGNFGIILDRTNFNMLREFEFVTDQFVSLWIEHHFDGFFLNKIPIINKLRLREVIYFRGLWGSYSGKNASLLFPPSDVRSPSKIPYMEASFGIENIFNMFRVDAMWRLTYRNTPGTPNFMVKIGFTPNF